MTIGGAVSVGAGASFNVAPGGRVFLSSGITSLGAVSIGASAALQVLATATACTFSSGGLLALTGNLATSVGCTLNVAASGSGAWHQMDGSSTFGAGAGLTGQLWITSSAGGVAVTAAVDVHGLVTVSAGTVKVAANGVLTLMAGCVQSAGQLAVDGALSVSGGQFTWTAGGWHGQGATTFATTAPLHVAGDVSANISQVRCLLWERKGAHELAHKMCTDRHQRRRHLERGQHRLELGLGACRRHVQRCQRRWCVERCR